MLFVGPSGTQLKNQQCFDVLGIASDPYYMQSRCWAELLQRQVDESNSVLQAKFNFWGPRNRKEFEKKLKEIQRNYPETQRHYGSPIIFEGCDPSDLSYVGGSRELISLLKQRYDVEDKNSECINYI